MFRYKSFMIEPVIARAIDAWSDARARASVESAQVDAVAIAETESCPRVDRSPCTLPEPPESRYVPWDSIPHSYEAIPDWAAKHLTGRLILKSRALRGLKHARYRSPHLVARCLLLLAHEYRDTRMSVPGSVKQLQRGLDRLGVRLGTAITRLSAWPDEYTHYILHPRPESKRKGFHGLSPYRLLDMHLRKGTSMNPRHCLAIYFFWDELMDQVVVGWLPSHLRVWGN